MDDELLLEFDEPLLLELDDELLLEFDEPLLLELDDELLAVWNEPGTGLRSVATATSWALDTRAASAVPAKAVIAPAATSVVMTIDFFMVLSFVVAA